MKASLPSGFFVQQRMGILLLWAFNWEDVQEGIGFPKILERAYVWVGLTMDQANPEPDF